MDEEEIKEAEIVRQEALHLSGLLMNEFERKDIPISVGFMACAYVITSILTHSKQAPIIFSALKKFLDQEMKEFSEN